MSINIINAETSETEFIYCDLCRGLECLYKCSNFKQYNGWYCRNCYEKVDEEADEEDDNSYIITLPMLRSFICVSTDKFVPVYYNMKMICNEIKNNVAVK